MAGAVLGGLLRGLGTGIVDRANQLREDALLRAREAREDRIIADDRNYQTSRDEATRGFQRERDSVAHARGLEVMRVEDEMATKRSDRQADQGGLLQTIEDDEGTVWGVPRGAKGPDDLIRFPIKAARGGSSVDEDGFSAADKRLWDTVKARHTTEGGLGGEVTDWTAMADEFQRRGRADMADLAMPPGQPAQISMQSEEWQRAEEMADERIKELTTVLGTDKKQLAEFGGSRTQAKLELTRQFYQQLTGQEAPAQAGGSSAEQPAQESADLPSGAGTEASPYEPTTQAQYDAIPVSQLYRNPDDGKVYRKN